MINSYLKLSTADIKHLLSFKTASKNMYDKKKLLLSSLEYEKLNDLRQILEDLYVFTQIIQGDGITVSKILPALNTVTHTLGNTSNLKHLKSTAISLKTS